MDASERRARATEEAADWWASFQSEDAIPHEQRAAFVEWLRESPVHVAELLRIARVHDTLDQFPDWAALATNPAARNRGNVVELHPDHEWVARRSQRRFKRPGLWLGAIAATVLIAIGVNFGPRLFDSVIETAQGERREVTLKDGSVVQVDPETRLRVAYAHDERRVVLERGRALFRVAKHSARAFRVQAGTTTIQALGTSFGVEATANVVLVTVAEGKVAVTSPQLEPQLLPPSSSQRTGSEGFGKGAVFLDHDQQVTVEAVGTPHAVRVVDSQSELAWAQGRLIFKDTPAGDVVTQFNRYNHLQLQITDPVLRQRPISAVFNAQTPEAFVAFLQAVAAVSVTRDGDRSITISRQESP